MTYVPKLYNTQVLEKLPFPTKECFELVVVAEINYFEVDNNYCTLFRLNGTSLLIIKSLNDVMKMLPHKTFYRTHDKYIVNGNQCHKYFKKDFQILMENGVTLKVAERKDPGFIAFLCKIKSKPGK